MVQREGHWKYIVPPKPSTNCHACQVPSDEEILNVAGRGSEWVCNVCGAIWEVRQPFWSDHVSLYRTQNNPPRA